MRSIARAAPHDREGEEMRMEPKSAALITPTAPAKERWQRMPRESARSRIFILGAKKARYGGG
jgi:hypothetical protein